VEPIGPDDQTPKAPRTELIGVFDAGTGSAGSGIQAVTNIQVANGTVQVGVPSGAAYLQFTPGQVGPLQTTATRTSQGEAANLTMAWSYDVTDAAGNVSHCNGPAAFPPVAGTDSYSTMQATPLSVSAPGVLAN